MGRHKRIKMREVISWVVIISMIIGMFLMFTTQNRERILIQNENYVQDNAEKTARQMDDILVRSLANIEMMAHWFGKTLDGPVVTQEELQELTDSSDFD